MSTLLFALNSFANESTEVFWQGKPEIKKRIASNREILVVVTAKPSGEKFHLKMQGVGVAAVPPSFSFNIAKNFEKLKQISDYIKEVQYNKAESKLFIHSAAFGYHAKMWMRVHFVDTPMRQIHYHIVKGTFAGMKGQINFKDYKRRKTQTEFLANYEYKKLGIPKFFIEFGLEVVIQKIAVKMRSFIEEEYKNGKK